MSLSEMGQDYDKWRSLVMSDDEFYMNFSSLFGAVSPRIQGFVTLIKSLNLSLLVETLLTITDNCAVACVIFLRLQTRL